MNSYPHPLKYTKSTIIHYTTIKFKENYNSVWFHITEKGIPFHISNANSYGKKSKLGSSKST